MPVKYRIDKLARIVHSQAGGKLTDAEALTNQFGLKADPNFNPSYREFFDFSDVKPFSMTARGIQSLASSSPWGDGAQRAFVAGSDHAFGMLRMHEILLDASAEKVAVFRTAGEAWRWLEEAPSG